MTAPTRDEVKAMAREAGTPDPMVFLAAYERLVAAAYTKGQEDMRERCVKLCESMEYEFKAGHECAAAIHAMPMQRGGEA